MLETIRKMRKSSFSDKMEKELFFIRLSCKGGRKP